MHTWPQNKKKGLRPIGISDALVSDEYVEQLVDTDDNRTDFGDVDFRGSTILFDYVAGTYTDITDALWRVWPRNGAAGSWNPVTGLPRVDPIMP